MWKEHLDNCLKMSPSNSQSQLVYTLLDYWSDSLRKDGTISQMLKQQSLLQNGEMNLSKSQGRQCGREVRVQSLNLDIVGLSPTLTT